MKKKLTRNLFLKILSVIFAFTLWLMVVIVTDPYKTVIISNVPITILNEEEITGQGIGQIYSVVSPQDRTVSVRVYGQKSKVDKLTANDITAVVDFGVVSSVGAAYIEVSEPEGVSVLSKTPEMFKIEIEALEQKSFDVALELSGTPADNYLINDARISPNITTVTAPESVMQKIDKVGVKVDVSGLANDIMGIYQIVLYDAAGKVINYAKNENVALSVNDVQAYVETFMVKEVAVDIKPGGKLPDKHVLMSFDYEPKTITVKGKKEDLMSLDTITIGEDTKVFNLSSIKSTTDYTADISMYIPAGIYLVNEDGGKITAHIEVERIVEKSFEVPVTELRLFNMPKDMELEYTDPSQIVKLTVEGYEADLQELTLEDIAPYINLTKATEGTSYYGVKVRASSEFTIKDEPIVNLTLKPIVEETILDPETGLPIETTTEQTGVQGTTE